MKPLIVLSLFDGISCGRVAFERAGIPIEKYYASEIDKHAIKVSEANYQDIIRLGDVTKWKEWNIDWQSIDIIIAGSPCQGFSFAGKQLAFDDPRSKLFFEFINILEYTRLYNPKVMYLLENVRMKTEHENAISQILDISPININSSLVSAQNRERLYWTNIYNEPYGLFGFMECKIPQPKDRGIILKDILLKEVEDKYYLSDKMIKYFNRRKDNFNRGKVNIRDENGKASTITSSSSNIDISDNFIQELDFKEEKRDVKMNIRDPDGKASCILPSNEGKQGTDMNLIAEELTQIGQIGEGNKQGYRVYAPIKSVTLQGESGGVGAKTGLYLIEDEKREVKQINPNTESNGVQPYQKNRVYDTNGLSPALLADMSSGTHAILEEDQAIIQRGRGFNKGGEHTEKSPPITSNSWEHNNTLRIRRLHPIECERLQTLPDNFTSAVSSTQRYRGIGNGWTVDVIAHIFSFIHKNLP